MKNIAWWLFAAFLLPVALTGATDEDVLLNDEDATIDSDVSFDMPPEATDWPDGREKHFCTCPLSETDSLYWHICRERPFYYLIKIQNWGGKTAHDVMVVDNLFDIPKVNYLPDTTEMATQFDENGDGTDWTTIPDGPNGEFPLAGDGYKVAATMTPCDQVTWSCANTRLIRFKLMPKVGLPRSELFSNIATIKEKGSSIEYETNKGVALRLIQADCRPKSECPEPPKSLCGGGEDIVFPDDDAILADGTVTDSETTNDTTAPDTDTSKPKDDGCGCSVVF
jgi:hypothetical protein